MSETFRLAYADPPYLGQGKRLYGKHHDEAAKWDDLQAHIDLLQQLDRDYDGYAYSLTSTSLQQILPYAPEGTRVGAWVKTFAAWRSVHRVQYTWEPIIFKPVRAKGGRGIPSVRDFVSCRIAMRKGLPGAKPDEFNDWIIELLGWKPGDTLDDLFPGTNGLSKALQRRIEATA